MKCISFKTNVPIVLRNIAMLVIILSGSTKTVAQEWDHEYFPFVEEGKVWNCGSISPKTATVEAIDCIFTMRGDTLIGENYYQKVFCQFKGYYGNERQHYYCAVREEAYRVFIVEAESKEEKMLYDFSQPKETQILSYENHKYARLSGVHPTSFSYYANLLTFDLYEIIGDEINFYNGLGVWVEGIGNAYGNPFACDLYSDELSFGIPITVISCVKDDVCYYWREWMSEPSSGPSSIQEMSKSISGAPIYDLQGRRLSAAPQKGVYIQNGKKKLVK